MDRVARFIDQGNFRLALARLGRLAGMATDDGRRQIDDWENRHHDSEGDVQRALGQLEIDPPYIAAATIEEDPLLWLRALDQYCQTAIRPGTYAVDQALDDGDGKAWLIPENLDRRSTARGRQRGNLKNRLVHHRLVPTGGMHGIPHQVVPLPHACADWLARHAPCGGTVLAIGHFDDGVEPSIEKRTTSSFSCTGLTDPAKRLASIYELIRKAKQEGAHFLVLPELTVPADMRIAIREHLRDASEADAEMHDLAIPIIVLGSFHQRSSEAWHNRSEMICGLDGSALLCCDKRKGVTVPFPDESAPRREHIDNAPTPLSALHVPTLGLIALAICKDLFEGEPADALRSIAPDWLLVPSMSNDLGPHQAAAKQIHNLSGTTVAVANQEMPGADDPVHGFVWHRELRACSDSLQIIKIEWSTGPLTVVK